MELTRREVIGLLGIAGLGLIIKPDITNLQDLSFLDFESSVPTTNVNDVVINYVPLGTQMRRQLSNDQELGIIYEHIRQQEQVTGQRYFPQEFTSQMYGVPLDFTISESLRKHCQLAESYLKSRLAIDNFDVDWTVPILGNNYEDDFDGKGFLVDGFFEVFRYYFLKEDGSEYITLRAQYHSNSAVTRTWISNGDPWKIILTPGKNALISPFSEMVPRLTYSVDRAYAEETDELAAARANEALSEAMAYHLGLEFIVTLRRPDLSYIIEQTTADLTDERYALVNLAIEWIRNEQESGRDGVRGAFDLYMTGPDAFVDQITG